MPTFASQSNPGDLQPQLQLQRAPQPASTFWWGEEEEPPPADPVPLPRLELPPSAPTADPVPLPKLELPPSAPTADPVPLPKLELPPSAPTFTVPGGATAAVEGFGAVGFGAAAAGAIGLVLGFSSPTANDSAPKVAPSPKPSSAPSGATQTYNNPNVGCADGALYQVSYGVTAADGRFLGTNTYQVWGPVGAIYEVADPNANGHHIDIYVACRGLQSDHRQPVDSGGVSIGSFDPTTAAPEGFSISRVGGGDNCNPTQQLATPPYQVLPIGPGQTSSPSLPPSSSPNASPQPQPQQITVPGSNPVTVSVPGGTPTTVNPTGPGPTQINLPSNNPIIGSPQFDLPGLPATSPGAGPVSISSPGATPTQITFPDASPGTPVQVSIPGYQPITVNPNQPSQNTGLNQSNPFNPQQLTPQQLGPVAPQNPANPANPQQNPLNPQQVTNDAAALAVVTLLLQQIQANTAPQALQQAAAAAACEESQPGGCIANAVKNNSPSSPDPNAINKLNTALQGLDLSLLAVINNKLGNAIPGGIGPFLSKFKDAFDAFKEWKLIDRAIGMFTFLTALHNAFMLSQSLEITLVQVVSDWIKVIEPFFGIDPDKNPIDLNKIIDSTIEGFFEKLIGKEKVKKYEELFKTLNRIYQASTNLLNNVQMLFFGITMSLQIVAHSQSSIGNALKKYGVVGHNAYPWMNPSPTLTNKWVGAVNIFTEKTNGLIAGAFAIDIIAQGILSGRQAADQIGKEKDDLKAELFKAYSEVEEVQAVPEHKNTAVAATKSTADSKGKPITQEGLSGLDL